MRIQKVALFFLLLLSFSAQAAEPISANADALGFSPQRLGRLDDWMKSLAQSGHMPGGSLLVMRHGKQVFFNTYGVADLQTAHPIARDSIFRIYSQTKAITGTALMILFEEGKWRLSDPVTRFIPEFKNLQVFKEQKADGSLVFEPMTHVPTMRELVTHNAGFAYGLVSDTPAEKLYAEADFMAAHNAKDAIDRLAKLPLAFQPGQKWSYSAAVDIQGYIVERITGMTLGEFMKRRIFVPLKMHDTAFYVAPEKVRRLVTLYAGSPNESHPVAPSGVLVWDFTKPHDLDSGGAGLVSTIDDYARFAQMILNKGELDGTRILAPATVKLMGSNLLSDEARNAPNSGFRADSGGGFGVDFALALDNARIGSLQGNGTLSWGGAAGSWYWIDPENDMIVLGMMQIMNRWQDSVLSHVDDDSSVLIYQALVNPRK